jgi:magnesium chelatase family protein
MSLHTDDDRQVMGGRLSGPLRDRNDLIVEVPAVPITAIANIAQGEPSSAVRERVLKAREVEHVRYDSSGARTNADNRGGAVARYCQPDADGRA